MIDLPRRAPTLRTRRLVLRPLRVRDVDAVARLIADPEVTRWLLAFPHGDARAAAGRWIGRSLELELDGRGPTLAISRGGRLIGAIGLRIAARHAHAELGYWLGAAHWGRGYAVEAGRAMVTWGFQVVGLRRIFGQYLGDNRASGRVMERIGMIREGVRRMHVRKAGRWYDAHQFGMLREDLGER